MRNKLMAGSVAALALATFVSYVMRWGYFARAVAPDLVADGPDAEEEEVDIFAQ